VVSDLGIALSGSQGESDEGLSAKTSVRKKKMIRYYNLLNRMSATETLTSIAQGDIISLPYAYHSCLPDDEG
jgi:hypothetical protein